MATSRVTAPGPRGAWEASWPLLMPGPSPAQREDGRARGLGHAPHVGGTGAVAHLSLRLQLWILGGNLRHALFQPLLCL